MVTDNLIRDEFFRRTLARDFQTIFQAQLSIAEKDIYGDHPNSRQTGQLRRFLQSAQANASKDGAMVEYPKYIRFLDMKKKGNYRIYNRQLWGVIYNETLPELKYGLSSIVRAQMRSQLEGLFGEKTG